MSQTPRDPKTDHAPSAVKRRSLSNYLSNIQHRKEELEKSAKVNSEMMKASMKARNDGEENQKKSEDSHGPNSNIEECAKLKVAKEERQARLVPDIAATDDSKVSGDLASKIERDSMQSGDITEAKETPTIDTKDAHLIVTDDKLNETSAIAGQPQSTDLKDNEQKTPIDQSQDSHITKLEAHGVQGAENRHNSVLAPPRDSEESDLSEVDSDAPTEPASPPRPRLGRLIRGDQLKSSPSRRAPHLNSENSDESDLSDIEDINHLPISSSILHADSSPHKPSHFNLNSSPANLMRTSNDSPVHRKKHVAVRKKSKSKKSSVHRDAGGRTKLQIACDKGNYEVARRLIQEGYNVDDQDNAGNSSLHEAALNGHLDIVELLLESGASVNVQSHEPIRDTPLIDAAANGHLDVVKVLLRHRADPTITNSKGLTAIESIEEDVDLDYEELQIVRNIKEELRKATKKFYANNGRRARSISSSKHSDSDRSSSNVRMEEEFYWTDITSKIGREKLLRASKEGKLSYVGAYLENGGRVDFKSFLEAVKYGHEDITSLFLAFGAQPNMTSREGQTPLMVSVGRGHTGTVKLLLESGADPLVKDKQGRSVLNYAKRSELGLVSKQEIDLIQDAINAKSQNTGGSGDESIDVDNSSTNIVPQKPIKDEHKTEIQSSRHPHSGQNTSTLPQKRLMSPELPEKSHSMSPRALPLDENKRASTPPSMEAFLPSTTAKKPKLESSLSPKTTRTASEPSRSQTTTPANSFTPKAIETAEEKEHRLKAEEIYRQKRLLNKKRKEQEFLQKIAEDERKRAEELQRQNAEEAKRIEEEKAKREQEAATRRVQAELEHRRQVRAQYPLGLRLVDFENKCDYKKFLPVYFVIFEGVKYVLELQMCILLKDLNFMSAPRTRREVLPAHKEQIWNIYKFIFLCGGDGPSPVDLGVLTFNERSELEFAEFQKFCALPLHWVTLDTIQFPANLRPLEDAVKESMTELYLKVAPNPSDESLSSQVAPENHITNIPNPSSEAQTPRPQLQGIPPKLRNRSSITSIMNGPIPSCSKSYSPIKVKMLRSSFSRVARVTPTRFAQTQAISKAAIVDLHSRWEDLPAAEQQDLVTKLTERQKLPWVQLTETEKQAAWYISYGEWGPRRPVHAKGDGAYIAKGVVVGLVGSVALFAFIRQFGGEEPKTMTKEWQLKSDEYLKSKNANPWGGYSQVQSK